jgi:hypothetical protein
MALQMRKFCRKQTRMPSYPLFLARCFRFSFLEVYPRLIGGIYSERAFLYYSLGYRDAMSVERRNLYYVRELTVVVPNGCSYLNGGLAFTGWRRYFEFWLLRMTRTIPDSYSRAPSREPNRIVSNRDKHCQAPSRSEKDSKVRYKKEKRCYQNQE